MSDDHSSNLNISTTTDQQQPSSILTSSSSPSASLLSTSSPRGSVASDQDTSSSSPDSFDIVDKGISAGSAGGNNNNNSSVMSRDGSPPFEHVGGEDSASGEGGGSGGLSGGGFGHEVLFLKCNPRKPRTTASDDTSSPNQVSPKQTQPSTKAETTPKIVAVASDEEEEDDDEDIEDETLLERIQALSEIFPSWLVKGVCSISCNTGKGVKWAYSTGCSVSWIIFTSAAVLVMPVMFELERSSVEEQQKAQQRQILLGPGAGISGPPGLPPSPLMGPPPMK